MRLSLTILFAMAVFLSGCGWLAKEFRQKEIADGLSRLSVQYMSALVSEANKEIDFGNKAKVIIEPSEDPKEHGKGRVIWELKDVEVNYPEEIHFYKDCQGNKAFWRGKAIINARKILYGRLTQNEKSPVIPDPGSLRIEVEARVENLLVYFPGKGGRLEVESGTFIFEAYPRLAQGPTGMRVVPTSNTRFSKVRLKNVKGKLFSSEVDLPVEIDDADLEAQVGIGDDGKENELSGHITIFGNRHEVPFDGKGLDPSYNADDFVASFACTEDLKRGLSYEHIALEKRLAPAIAGFSARALGYAAGELEKNAECGFLSAGVVNTLELQGKVGENGHFVATLPEECVIKFAQLQTAPNCFGEANIIDGTIIVKKARKIINGFVIGTGQELDRAKKLFLDKLAAKLAIEELSSSFPKIVIPKSVQPIEIILEADLSQLTIKEICLNEGSKNDPEHCTKKKIDRMMFSGLEGHVKGILRPYLAKDLREESQAKNTCSIPTPISEAKIDISSLSASIYRGKNTVHFLVNGSYELINGRINDKENILRGYIDFGSDHIAFQSGEKDHQELDTTYSWDDFKRGFLSCTSTIELPLSDEECIPEDLLAEDVARLVVRNSGAFLKVGSSSEIPNSFSSLRAISSRELKDDGKILILRARNKSEINLSSKKIHRNVDAHHNEFIIDGALAKLEGKLVRSGEPISTPQGFWSNLNPLNSRFGEAISARIHDKQELFVRPTRAQSTNISLSADMKDFSVKEIIVNEEEGPYLILHNGTLEIEARPVMGIDKRTSNDANPSYSIVTPVIEFDAITVRKSEARIQSPVMNIPLFIESAELYAMNGFYEGRGNSVSGTLRFYVGKARSSKPIEYKFNGLKLIKDFSQEKFDATYAHTPYLKEVIAP